MRAFENLLAWVLRSGTDAGNSAIFSPAEANNLHKHGRKHASPGQVDRLLSLNTVGEFSVDTGTSAFRYITTHYH